MSSVLVDRFARWFEHECLAFDKVVESLDTVPVGCRDGADYVRALSILAHVIAARRMWLQRLGIVPASDRSLFPTDATLDEIIADWVDIRHHWSAYFSTRTDDALAQTFEYTSLDAGRFRNQIEDILAQLNGHAWYHRGQIAMLIRATGGTPAITDFIYYCREKVD